MLTRGTKAGWAAVSAAVAAGFGLCAYYASRARGRRDGGARHEGAGETALQSRSRGGWDRVEEAVDESFPATDPACYSPARAGLHHAYPTHSRGHQPARRSTPAHAGRES